MEYHPSFQSSENTRSVTLTSLSLRFSFVMFRYLSNGVYQLRNNASHEEYQVYCHMTKIPKCGLGGWTLVMKLDGNKVKIILYRHNFNLEKYKGDKRSSNVFIHKFI